jgi:hypothetical protein
MSWNIRDIIEATCMVQKKKKKNLSTLLFTSELRVLYYPILLLRTTVEFWLVTEPG